MAAPTGAVLAGLAVVVVAQVPAVFRAHLRASDSVHRQSAGHFNSYSAKLCRGACRNDRYRGRGQG